MTSFRYTADAEQFIATAAARETSPEIMEGIAFFARNIKEAEALWNGDFAGICNPSDLWENVTRNGLRDADEFCWGAAGHDWWGALNSTDA